MSTYVDASTSPLYHRRLRKYSEPESDSDESEGGCDWGSVPYFECYNKAHTRDGFSNCNVGPFLRNNFGKGKKHRKRRDPNKSIADFSSSEDEYQENIRTKIQNTTIESNFKKFYTEGKYNKWGYCYPDTRSFISFKSSCNRNPDSS